MPFFPFSRPNHLPVLHCLMLSCFFWPAQVAACRGPDLNTSQMLMVEKAAKELPNLLQSGDFFQDFGKVSPLTSLQAEDFEAGVKAYPLVVFAFVANRVGNNKSALLFAERASYDLATNDYCGADIAAQLLKVLRERIITEISDVDLENDNSLAIKIETLSGITPSNYITAICWISQMDKTFEIPKDAQNFSRCINIYK